ncbi:hypothetical protein MTR62_08060 [Novosphingobium sp. 1949]|uniref:Alpha/beta hydrolase n=1 Tax=Novosphingobium organovorum TaxID=2930092 RepID=A0ABT0BC66_9SPHN|nr:hypothetical protein [Novosphingobium organovorum]MCJ2182644.1 hypothetical protein [Novosphingobium organovorum]
MIVFEGCEIVIHHQHKTNDLVVVSFAPGGVTHEALTTFWGMGLFDKIEISAIGVTTKVDNWFISPDEDAFVAKIEELITPYETVVLMGCSMGAHTAIRLSRRLRARATLALAPKFSLDETEFPQIERRYVDTYFREDMRGMGLRREDAAGMVFIAYDPLYEADKQHALRILDEMPNAIPAPTFYTEHGIADHLSGNDNMRRITMAMAHGLQADVLATLLDVRRRHWRTVQRIIDTRMERKPVLCARLLNNALRRQGKYENLRHWDRRFGRLYYHLRRAGRGDLAPQIINLKLGDTPLDPGSSRQYLMSFHGGLLCYDTLAKTMCMAQQIQPEAHQHPIFVRLQGEDVHLQTEIDGKAFFLSIDTGRVRLTDTIADHAPVKLVESRAREWIFSYNRPRVERGHVAISAYGYVMPTEDGNVIFTSRNDLVFESFVLIGECPGWRRPAPANASPDTASAKALPPASAVALAQRQPNATGHAPKRKLPTLLGRLTRKPRAAAQERTRL